MKKLIIIKESEKLDNENVTGITKSRDFKEIYFTFNTNLEHNYLVQLKPCIKLAGSLNNMQPPSIFINKENIWADTNGLDNSQCISS